MANKACINRLQKEYRALLKDPVEGITAHPNPSNILEWHYVLAGLKGTEYEGGVYHGKVTFPSQYPYKPPSITMSTPNGRFSTNTKLCLSMTDFHPESWNPMWSVGTILTGLASFMFDTQPTTGSISTTKKQKEEFAAQSLAANVKSPIFRKLFPEWVDEHNKRLKQQEEERLQESLQSASLNDASSAPARQTGSGGPALPAAERQGLSLLTSLGVLVLVVGVVLVPLYAG